MLIGITSALSKFRKTSLPFIKDNLKLYLDFKSNKSDTLKFPSDGSTAYSSSTSTFINFGDNDTLDMGTSSFTCAGWIKLNASSSTSRMMLGKTQNASGAKWAFGVSGSEQAFISISDGSTTATETGATTISIGEWVHVVGVYDTDADTLSVFLNGVQDATMSASGIGSLSNSLDLRSGRGAEYPYNYNNAFDVCNIAIWKRALEPEEIQSIQNKSYSQLKGVEKTSLVSWWGLDADSLSEQLFTDTTWQTQGSSQTATHNGNFNFTVTNDGTGNQAYRPSIDFPTTAGKTYKMTLTPTSKTGTINALFHNGFNTGGGYQGDFSFDGNSTYVYYYTGYHSGFLSLNGTTGAWSITFDILVQETNYQLDSKGTNHGSTFGATINSNVYGGNAPILPRAVDVAKEGQADAIGNGSASFNGTSDHVDTGTGLPDITSQGFTISGWFNFDSVSATHWLWGRGTGSGSGYAIKFDTTPRLIAQSKTASSYQYYASNYTFSVGEWYHITFVHSGTGTTPKIYINGIENAGSGAWNSDIVSQSSLSFKIGSNDSTSNEFNGNISQVGIWQGELTQAQIQSVMESTSYSKIPADVKSTLTQISLRDFAGVADGTDPTTLSYIFAYGTPGEKTIDNERLKIVDSNNTGVYWKETGLTSSKLYKITVEATGDVASNGVYSSDLSFTLLNGTFTGYVTGKTQIIVYLRANDNSAGTTFYDNLKTEEVTNDIVAYYPLDGSSSANGVTQDVTTGETLGSELISNGSFDTDTTGWIKNNGSMDVVNGELKVITSSSYWEGVRYNFGAVVSGGIYKAVFTARLESGNTPQIQFSGASGSSTYSNATSISGSSNVTYTFYFIANANNSNTYLTFFNGAASSSTFYLDNVSLKKVTSNTGVLK